MLRRYSKARSGSATSTVSQNDVSQADKPANAEMYDKRVQELSREIDESQKKADQVSYFVHKENSKGASWGLEFRTL
jgi:hypothetical protein